LLEEPFQIRRSHHVFPPTRNRGKVSAAFNRATVITTRRHTSRHTQLVIFTNPVAVIRDHPKTPNPIPRKCLWQRGCTLFFERLLVAWPADRRGRFFRIGSLRAPQLAPNWCYAPATAMPFHPKISVLSPQLPRRRWYFSPYAASSPEILHELEICELLLNILRANAASHTIRPDRLLPDSRTFHSLAEAPAESALLHSSSPQNKNMNHPNRK